MKYLLVEIRSNESGESDKHTRFPNLESGMREYEKAKKDERNSGVYLCAILKEVDL